jgi:hypothetical protein
MKTLAQSLGERMEASYTDFRKLQEQTVDTESRWEERCKKLEDDLQIVTEEKNQLKDVIVASKKQVRPLQRLARCD